MCLDSYLPHQAYLVHFLTVLQIHWFPLCSSNIQTHSFLWVWKSCSFFPWSLHSWIFLIFPDSIQIYLLRNPFPNHPILCPHHMNLLSTQLIFFITSDIICDYLFDSLPIFCFFSMYQHLDLALQNSIQINAWDNLIFNNHLLRMN